jgi:hypothetical protein
MLRRHPAARCREMHVPLSAPCCALLPLQRTPLPSPRSFCSLIHQFQCKTQYSDTQQQRVHAGSSQREGPHKWAEASWPVCAIASTRSGGLYVLVPPLSITTMTLALRGGGAPAVQGSPSRATSLPARPSAFSRHWTLGPSAPRLLPRPAGCGGGLGSSGGSATVRRSRHCRSAPTAIVCSLPGWAAEKAVQALKEEHGKPTDREVAAATTATLAATASAIKYSKTAVGGGGAAAGAAPYPC